MKVRATGPNGIAIPSTSVTRSASSPSSVSVLSFGSSAGKDKVSVMKTRPLAYPGTPIVIKLDIGTDRAKPSCCSMECGGLPPLSQRGLAPVGGAGASPCG